MKTDDDIVSALRKVAEQHPFWGTGDFVAVNGTVGVYRRVGPGQLAHALLDYGSIDYTPDTMDVQAFSKFWQRELDDAAKQHTNAP